MQLVLNFQESDTIYLCDMFDYLDENKYVNYFSLKLIVNY